MKKLLVFIAILLVIVGFLTSSVRANAETRFWSVQSIDTMKFSRDAARAKLSDAQIEKEVKQIAATGVTHVAIDTPYDTEFLPVLKQWVAAARKYNLNVWFRGNFAGWEGWFDYPKNLTREKHLKLTKDFITGNRDLFQDSDIFTACPECENGGPGDPRNNDLDGFRQFIIDEYKVTTDSFKSINKKVTSNYFPMNGDVARLVMDPSTVAATGGVVTIDHYVATPEKLVADIADISAKSNAKIVLGEFGAPIPNINGNLSEDEQATWIQGALQKLVNSPNLIGMNYWTDMGSSTSIWNDDNSPRKAVLTVNDFFSPKVFTGSIFDNADSPINGIKITYLGKTEFTNLKGQFEIPYTDPNMSVKISAPTEDINTTISSMAVKNGKIIVQRNLSILDLIIHFLRSIL